MMVKKDSITDILDHLSEEELNRIMILKSGLEDLNLILQEIEETYQLLSGVNLTEKERKHQKLRLLSLERYMAELNQKVNTAMGTEEGKKKLS
ncbi:hypothetical protein ACMC5U_03915 [Deferribacteres bacterium DY0609]